MPAVPKQLAQIEANVFVLLLEGAMLARLTTDEVLVLRRFRKKYGGDAGLQKLLGMLSRTMKAVDYEQLIQRARRDARLVAGVLVSGSMDLTRFTLPDYIEGIDDEWRESFRRHSAPLVRTAITLRIVDDVILRFVALEKIEMYVDESGCDMDGLEHWLTKRLGPGGFEEACKQVVQDVVADYAQLFAEVVDEAKYVVEDLKKRHEGKDTWDVQAMMQDYYKGMV